ncbi:MAG: hypothetical protein IKP22_13890, partial [Clostridia bacterium]|nr:hypothetical protein [Clostridia bacterium]
CFFVKFFLFFVPFSVSTPFSPRFTPILFHFPCTYFCKLALTFASNLFLKEIFSRHMTSREADEHAR